MCIMSLLNNFEQNIEHNGSVSERKIDERK